MMETIQTDRAPCRYAATAAPYAAWNAGMAFGPSARRATATSGAVTSAAPSSVGKGVLNPRHCASERSTWRPNSHPGCRPGSRAGRCDASTPSENPRDDSARALHARQPADTPLSYFTDINAHFAVPTASRSTAMESASAISEAGALGGGGSAPGVFASMVARELQSVGRRKRIPDRKSRTERVIREPS